MTERQKDEYMSIKVTSVKIEPFNAYKINSSHQTPAKSPIKSPQLQKEDAVINRNNDEDDNDNNNDNGDDDSVDRCDEGDLAETTSFGAVC